jgi:hypothetical protein
MRLQEFGVNPLDQPEGVATDSLGNVYSECWTITPVNRPGFSGLIGEALECATEAGRKVRELGLEPPSSYLHKIGVAVHELWEIRDALYKLHPDIKRDFVSESEVDEIRFNALTALHAEALAAEADGRIAEAAAKFQQLLADSKFGFFKLCAEAGLWRTRK